MQRIHQSSMNKIVENIIIVCDYGFINGGAAKVAIRSAIELAEKNYNVFFYSAVGPLCQELKRSKVSCDCMNESDINNEKKLKAAIKGIWNRRAARDFKKYLDNFDRKNTVVHFHSWTKALSVSVIYEAINKRFKIVITLHDYFAVCPNGGLYNYQKNCLCYRKPMSFSCIFCNCDKRNYFQKLWRVIRQFKTDKYIKRNKDIFFVSISELNENLVKKHVK